MDPNSDRYEDFGQVDPRHTGAYNSEDSEFLDPPSDTEPPEAKPKQTTKQQSHRDTKLSTCRPDEIVSSSDDSSMEGLRETTGMDHNDQKPSPQATIKVDPSTRQTEKTPPLDFRSILPKTAFENNNSCEGLPSDSRPTKLLYQRVHKVFLLFLQSDTSNQVLPESEATEVGRTAEEGSNEAEKPRHKSIYTDEGDHVNRLMVREFIHYYARSKQKPSMHHVKEAIIYLQRRLDDEMQERNMVAKKGAIRDDSWITRYMRHIKVKEAKLKEEFAVEDLHNKIERPVPRTKILEVYDLCYTDGPLNHMAQLSRSNIATSFAHAFQTGLRGSDARQLTYHHSYLSNLEFLGFGEEIDNFIHRKGKTNRTGRIETKGFATHTNPRMDASAHHGLLMLHRFNVLKEPFPNFLNVEDYTNRPIYRAESSMWTALSAAVMQNQWKHVFEMAGIRCRKVTQQPRIQLQQRIADMGCSADVIERFIGHAGQGQKQKMNDNQRESYLTSYPVQAVTAAADGNPNQPDLHHPSWDIKIEREEMEPLCPYLYTEIDKVRQKMDAVVYRVLYSSV